jgi:Flp pilus assembly CpaE family ATPase
VLVVLTSAKGAPGVTTAALALAATWPSSGTPVLIECDPSGGDLITGFQLDAEPGLTSLAAAARREHGQRLMSAHAQRLPGGLPVVAAPAAAEQAAAASGVLLSSADWEAMSAANLTEDPANGPGALVIDVGRLPAGPLEQTSLARLLRTADAVLLVAANDSAGVVHAAARLDPLARVVRSPERLRLLLVEAGGYPARDVATALGAQVAGLLPFDPRAASALTGRAPPRGGVLRRTRPLHRSPLLKAAAALGRDLADSRPWRPPPPTGAPGRAAEGFVSARPTKAGPGETAVVSAWHEPGDGR